MASAPFLCSVVAVDFDIVVGDVTAPAGTGGFSLAHGDVDFHVVLCQDLLSEVLVEIQAPALGADLDVPSGAGEVDAHLIRVKVLPGVAHGAEDPTPVGVRAENRRLGQGGGHYGLGDGLGAFFGLCALDGAGDEMPGPLAVGGGF